MRNGEVTRKGKEPNGACLSSDMDRTQDRIVSIPSLIYIALLNSNRCSP